MGIDSIDTPLRAADVGRAMTSITDQIADMAATNDIALVGIRTGGEHVARRLRGALNSKLGCEFPMGVVDITLYRDDGFGPHDWPQVGATNLPFDITKHVVVLVDDVLYTGRTVRAALDAILDYGRPKAVRLAVLVDRGLRELPIAAEIVGVSMDTSPHEHVDVQLTEAGFDVDAVVLSQRGDG